MRILHTADWHLGKRLDFYSRSAEQAEVLEEIIQIADEQSVDIVLIAGDLFDTFNPPVEAVDLFYKTLKRLSKNGQRPVIAIAGNHDSPQRVDAPDPLARASGIIFIGQPKASISPFSIEDCFELTSSDSGFFEITFDKYAYPFRLIHTAYANEVRLKEYLDIDQKESALNEVLQKHWTDIANKYCDDDGVNVLMTHLYMMKKGGEALPEPEGEKPLKVGNADLVYSENIPRQIQYTALGHLHRYIPIGTDSRPINYSGSPLAYSFSESGQQKHVLIVDLEPKRPARTIKVPLRSGRALVRKTFDNINEAEEWLANTQNALIELSIQSEDYLRAQDISRLRKANDGIIHFIPLIKNENTLSQERDKPHLNEDMQTLFKSYFKSHHGGQEPNEDILRLFNELIHT